MAKYKSFDEMIGLEDIAESDKLLKGILWYIGRDKKEPVPIPYRNTFNMIILNVLENLTIDDMTFIMIEVKNTIVDDFYDGVFRKLAKIRIL